jgi:UDP-N-acetyl-D-glucosamine dehydrogenase
MSTEFIELAGKVNQQMPYHCLERIERALNDQQRPVKNSRILVLGASYKSGVGDIRESPALRVMEVLRDRGGIISYHDEFVPTLPGLGLESIALDQVPLEDLDAAVLVTTHPGIDYDSIAERTPLFIDLRGVTRGKHASNLIRL